MFENHRKSRIHIVSGASGQKLFENAKNGQFGESLKNWKLVSNSDSRQVTFN